MDLRYCRAKLLNFCESYKEKFWIKMSAILSVFIGICHNLVNARICCAESLQSITLD